MASTQQGPVLSRPHLEAVGIRHQLLVMDVVFVAGSIQHLGPHDLRGRHQVVRDKAVLRRREGSRRPASCSLQGAPRPEQGRHRPAGTAQPGMRRAAPAKKGYGTRDGQGREGCGQRALACTHGRHTGGRMHERAARGRLPAQTGAAPLQAAARTEGPPLHTRATRPAGDSSPGTRAAPGAGLHKVVAPGVSPGAGVELALGRRSRGSRADAWLVQI